MKKEEIIKTIEDNSTFGVFGSNIVGLDIEIDELADKILELQPTSKEIGCECQYQCGVIDYKRWLNGANWCKNFTRK